MITPARIAELAFAEAERYPARSAERRAAAALWTALITTKSVDAARSALAGFAAPDVLADAVELLHRLAAQTSAATAADAPTEGEPPWPANPLS